MALRRAQPDTDYEALRDWLVLHTAPIDDTARLANLVDYFVAEGFNPALSLAAAIRRSDAWHAAISESRLTKRYADPDAKAQTDPMWPAAAVFDVLGFHLLDTPRALFEDGEAMSHCVGSYWADVKSGSTVIYSIREGERRLATVEYFKPKYQRPSSWQIGQCCGRFNADPGAAISKAADEFLQHVRKGAFSTEEHGPVASECAP